MFKTYNIYLGFLVEGNELIFTVVRVTCSGDRIFSLVSMETIASQKKGLSTILDGALVCE